MPTDSPTADLPLLETRCGDCGGKGRSTEYDRPASCPHCGGTGSLPTEAGKRVLALMESNFRRMHGRLQEELGWEKD